MTPADLLWRVQRAMDGGTSGACQPGADVRALCAVLADELTKIREEIEARATTIARREIERALNAQIGPDPMERMIAAIEKTAAERGDLAKNTREDVRKAREEHRDERTPQEIAAMKLEVERAKEILAAPILSGAGAPARTADKPQCHPGLRCDRWPECESCGPPRL